MPSRKNTSLKPTVEIGAVERKLPTISRQPRSLRSLNQQQQQKFQAIREEHRRELIEKMSSQVMQKVGTDIKKVETDAEKVGADIMQKVQADFR